MKKMNKKGFTLAELLIVVAIIAVLVAIAIPVFTSQLEKSKKATDQANLRSAYAEAVAAYLNETSSKSGTFTLNGQNVSWTADSNDVVTVSLPSSMMKSSWGASNYTYSGAGFPAN